MAQLKDLLVIGSTHFVGDVYFNKIPKYNGTDLALNRDITISGTNGITVSNGTFDLSGDSDIGISISHDAAPTTGTKLTPGTGSGRTYITQIDVDKQGHIAKIYSASESDQSLTNYKTKQDKVNDPTASGNATAFIDTITQDANGKITVTKKNITAADLGIPKAMQFLGAYAAAPTKAFIDTDDERNLANGDVYLNTTNNKEYVYSNKAWVELGDESSYALKTITISAGTGLTGGGNLSANRTIGIKNSGVGTTQLADGSVTTAKIADGAVTSAKIADGTIAIGDLNSSTYSGAGNRKSAVLVAASADGQINSEKYAVTSGTDVKATMQYDTAAKAVKFVFAT